MWNPRTLERLIRGVESDSFILSMKYGKSDFFRYLDVSPHVFSLTARLIVELQTRREYEGFGSYPSFVRWEYRRIHRRLQDLPNLAGIHVWCQTGGWSRFRDRTFLKKSSLWNELNTRVTIRMFRYDESVKKALKVFHRRYLRKGRELSRGERRKEIAGLRRFLKLSDYLVLNVLYIPGFAYQSFYVHKMRVPPLIHAFWNSLTVTPLMRALICSTGAGFELNYRSFLRALKEMRVLAREISLPYDAIFHRDLFTLYYFAQEALSAKHSCRAMESLERLQVLFRERYEDLYDLKIVPPGQWSPGISFWAGRPPAASAPQGISHTGPDSVQSPDDYRLYSITGKSGKTDALICKFPGNEYRGAYQIIREKCLFFSGRPVVGVYVFGVPGVHHPEILQFLAEEDPFNLHRILSQFFLELVVQYRHGYLLWIVGEQFFKAVLQGDPGIIDLVHEEDIAPGELFFNLVDPLDLLGALCRLVVRAVEPQPHCQDGQVHVGLQDTGGYKTPGTDGNNQVRFESRSTDPVRHAGYGMMYVLIGKIEFFFGVHIHFQHTRGGAGYARQAGVLLDKCNRLQQNISMAVTIKDVARLAGVSTATVSRVLNHDRRIAPETFKAVREVIAASGYRRNTIARSLKTSRSHAVGFLTPEIANDFFMYIAEGVEERLQAEGYSLIICNTAEKAEIEEKRIDLLSDQRVDGVIIIPAGNFGAHYAALSERDIPAVVVDRMVGGFDCDAVLVDNIGGSYSAALRFFEAGVRRIGFIGGRQDLTTAQERWEGFRRAHEDHHIKIDPELVCFGDFHVDSGYELAGRLMALSDPPRHLFIANYFMHVGATRYLLQSGTGTVRGIQTAGFDSMDLVPLLGFSAFTLSQPMREMGQTAAELLLRRIRRQYEGPPRIRRLPTGIITHQSISP